jgi:hypothetical protein
MTTIEIMIDKKKLGVGGDDKWKAIEANFEEGMAKSMGYLNAFTTNWKNTNISWWRWGQW